MKLTRLKLTNFKGIRDMEIEAPNGCSLDIYGDNGTGKTTVADSITFVLFGKDTKGRAPDNFGIKTRENGEVIHKLEHSVEATFIEPDIKLQRVYKEVWSRSRGEAKKTLDRHTTEYYINGDEMKKKEFEGAVSDIVSDTQFKILTVPSFFAEDYHWSDRKKVLSNMVGDLDTQTIINLSPASDIEEYPEIVGDKDVDKVRSGLEKERKEHIEKLDEYPSLIRENAGMLKPVDLKGVEEKLSDLSGKKDELTEKLSVARSGGGVSDLQVKLEEIESERQKLVADHMESAESGIEDKRKALNEARDASDKAFEAVRDKKANIDYEETKVELQQREVESIKEQIAEVEALSPPEKPEESGNGDCPYCGKPMKDDQKYDDKLKEYYEELGGFNESKAQQLKSLDEDLESAETVLKEREKALEKAKKVHQDAKNEHGKLEKELYDAREAFESAKEAAGEVTDTNEYKDLIKRRDKLNEKIESIRSNKQGTVDEIQEQIAEISSEMKDLEEKKFQHKQNEQIKERIQELKDNISSTEQKLEEGEHKLLVIKKFQLAQAEIVTSRVNDLFDIVEWKMFDVQMNGEINDSMCEPVVHGIPYSDGLNNAMRVQAGIDIINTIGKHYGENAPVIIDNAESVVKLNIYGLQVISLYVSEDDKELRIEEV